MSHRIESFLDCGVEINGHWYTARPLRGGFRIRLREAIQVLKGKATAVTFQEDELEGLKSYYQCNKCGHIVDKEEEAVCWKCGKGQMTLITEQIEEMAESFDEHTCQCGEPVSHKDADTCLACVIDKRHEEARDDE